MQDTGHSMQHAVYIISTPYNMKYSMAVYTRVLNTAWQYLLLDLGVGPERGFTESLDRHGGVGLAEEGLDVVQHDLLHVGL